MTTRVDNVRDPGSSDDSSKPTADRSILKHFRQRMEESKDFCAECWRKWEENQAFAGGDQMAEKERKRREKTKRPTFILNDCGLAARAVSGWEITARFEPTFMSRDPTDAAWTEALRDVVRDMRAMSRAEDVESDAFRDLAIGSYAVVEWSQRFDGDEPRGRTVCETNPLWEYLWDPKAHEVCLRDRAWDARGWEVDVDEFVMMFPDREQEIKDRLRSDRQGAWSDAMEKSVDYKHPFYGYADKGAFLRPKKGLIFLVDYHWREVAPAWTARVPPGVAPHPVGPEAWKKICDLGGIDPLQFAIALAGPEADLIVEQSLKPLLAQAVAQGVDPVIAALAKPTYIKMDRETWEDFAERAAQVMGQEPESVGPDDGNRRWVRKSATIAGEDVLRVKTLPYRHFPRIFLTGVPVKLHDGTRMQSVVESMKSPQKFKNFITTLAATLLQKGKKMGMIIRPNSLEDEADVEERFAEPFAIFRAKPGVDPASIFHELDGPDFPAGLAQFMELANNAPWHTTGLNPNILAQLPDPRRVSGVVWNQQVEVVTKVLAWEFNALRTLRLISGELLADFAATYMEPEDIERILGPTRAHLVPPKSEWKSRLRYDAVVAEIPSAKTAQEEAWDYLTRQGVDRLVSLGILPSWVVVEMMPDAWLSPETRKKIFAWMDAQGTGPNSPPPPPQGGEQPPPEEG
jgi:hypothetical protein